MCFLIAGNSTQCSFINESIADLIDNSTFPLGRHIETGMYKFCIDKMPMGHIAHLRNQFKSMNILEGSYDYIYYKIGPVVQ